MRPYWLGSHKPAAYGSYLDTRGYSKGFPLTKYDTMNDVPQKRISWPGSGIETLLIAVLVMTVVIISWPAMTAPQLLDDIDQLSHVSRFESWRDVLGPDVFRLFRPLKNLIFYTHQDVSLFHWHAFTLAGYVMASLAVYALFRRLFGSRAWAFVGALLWATCPTQVSTAVWMSAVNLSLAMVFSCFCIIAHDLSRERPGRNVGLTIVAVIMLFMAQISYETAVAVPALCVLVDLYRKRPLFSRSSLARYAILGIVTLTYLAIRSHFGAVNSVESVNYGFSPDIKAWQLSVSAPWFLWRHFSMWMFPLGRVEFCSAYIWGKSATMTELVMAWCWLFAMAGAAGLAWKRLPLVTVGILWFLAASFPPSNFIPIWSGPIEDYYLVFPGVGLAMVIMGLTQPLWEWLRQSGPSASSRRKLTAICLLAVAAAWRLSGIPLFWLQADLWKRPVELYLRAEATRPYQFPLQASAARELMIMGKTEEAKAFATQSNEIGPWYPSSSSILGYIALQQGDFPLAVKQLGKTLDTSGRSPVHDFARLNLAIAIREQKAEVAHIRKVLLPLLTSPNGPQHQKAIFLLFDVYLENEQLPEALNVVRKAISLHPGDSKYSELLKALEAKHPDLFEPSPR